jgi:hypothetical protein
MHKDKFVKGHFKASCNFESADGKHFVGFGDEFDVSEVLNANYGYFAPLTLTNRTNDIFYLDQAIIFTGPKVRSRTHPTMSYLYQFPTIGNIKNASILRH